MTNDVQTEGAWTFTPEHDGSLSLEAAVFQAVGGASACWENLAGAGVFDSDRAKQIAETLIEFIESERASGSLLGEKNG